MNRRKEEQIPHMEIADIQVEDSRVKYNDEELVFIDNLRDVPDFTTCKIAFNVAIMCRIGRLQLDVSGETATVAAGQTIVCHSHVIITNFMASPDIECKVLCASDTVLKTILQSQIVIWNRALYQRHYRIFSIDSEKMSSFDQSMHIFHHTNSPFKHDILVSMLRASFLQVCELLMENGNQANVATDGSTRMDVLFQRFLENLSNRKVKKIPVADYAAELCITPKYLSTLCRKASGKSPLQWISEYVMEDISYYLKNTTLSAKEISDELGFPNSSFFGKYVREHLGSTPTEFRRKWRAGDAWQQGRQPAE